MLYNKGIVLCFFTSILIAIAYAAEQNEINHIERMKTMNDQKQSWISQINKLTASKAAGEFECTDQNGNQLILTWEKIDPKDLQFPMKFQKVIDLLTESYTAIELDFTKKKADQIANDFMLKSLEPYFRDSADKIDWNIVEQKIKAILKQFLSSPNFIKSFASSDLNFFVMAKDKKTGELLGFIQFLIMEQYAYGDIRIALFGVTLARQNQGIEKLLVSSIFKFVPSVKRLFLHIRNTNEKALNMYNSLDFQKFEGPLENWIDLEYVVDNSNKLQNISKLLI